MEIEKKSSLSVPNPDLDGNGQRCGGTFGLILMGLSAMSFSFMSLTVHVLGASEGFPSFELVCIRALFGLVMTVGILQSDGSGVSLVPPPASRRTMAMRCFFGIISVSGNWFILTQLTLSDATVVVFTAPFFTVVMGHYFLREYVKPEQMMFMMLSISGLLLVVRPQFLGFAAESRPAYASFPRYICVIIGICCAVCSAATNLLVRKLIDVHAMVIMFWFFLSSLMVCPFLLLYFQHSIVPTSTKTWLLCAGVGVFGFAGQAFKTYGLKHENAGLGAMMRNLDVAFALVYQVVLLDEPLHKLSIVGACLILASSLSIGYLKVRETRRKKVQAILCD